MSSAGMRHALSEGTRFRMPPTQGAPPAAQTRSRQPTACDACTSQAHADQRVVRAGAESTRGRRTRPDAGSVALKKREHRANYHTAESDFGRADVPIVTCDALRIPLQAAAEPLIPHQRPRHVARPHIRTRQAARQHVSTSSTSARQARPHVRTSARDLYVVPRTFALPILSRLRRYP